MIKTEIELMLNSIFEKRTGIDFTKNPELKDLKLLGKAINLPVRELVLILYDIEQHFGINVPKGVILDGNFDSYSHIAKLLAAQCENNNILRKEAF